MGTNYYWQPNGPSVKCSCCGHTPEPLQHHIGKSSYGWTFSFHTVSEENIRTWKDWQEKLKAGAIVDEYGQTTPLEAFVQLVEVKAASDHNHAREYFGDQDRGEQGNYLDPEGHSFSHGYFS